MLLRAILLLLAAAAFWRASAQDEVVLRTSTNLVEVRVVAIDRHGTPVANLRKSDFEIQDNHHPQHIRLFAAYHSPAASTSAAAGASEDSSPTPAEFAVILLDWMNCTYTNRVFVKDEVLKLIRNSQPRQRLAVFVLSRKNPRLLSDFTYDRDALAYMVENLRLNWENPGGSIRDEPIGGVRGGRAATPISTPATEARLYTARNQLVDTTSTLEKIADHLQHVPGRKALLWVSSGVPMTVDGSYYAPFIEPALGKLNRSDTAIYAIDAKGIDDHPSDSLFSFAERTGGLTFYLSNDLAGSMLKALQDTDISYTLGFHMPDDATPGLHAITVRVNRPGVRLRYRESYDPSIANR